MTLHKILLLAPVCHGWS